MKKIFTLIALAASTVAAMATDYTDRLSVVINGAATAPAAVNTISVVEEGAGYTLTLKNFELTLGGVPMSVGTIVVPNVSGTAADGSTVLKSAQAINIVPGDATPTGGFWMGPSLGDVPVDIVAEMTADHLYAIITINLPGMNIEVTFGEMYQVVNSDFEFFHTAATSDGSVTSDEPNSWHSFMSSTGMLAAVVSSVPHTFIGNEARPGSAGMNSVLIKSGLALGSIVANGTLTTGQLQAGGFSATSTKNNAFLDITNTEKDANGDPFYTLLNGRPDSVTVWVKFKQDTPVEEHPYATITAAVTNGSYYQEPIDKDYNDIIVARAENNKIESLGNTWQRLSIPFDYDTYTAGATPKALFVTISTNADPGEGTGADSLYVDDFELVYNYSATAISVQGTAIEGFDKDKTEYNVTINGDANQLKAEDFVVTTDAHGATVATEIALPDNGKNEAAVDVTVTSNDLKHSKTYFINVTGKTTDNISTVGNDADNAVKAVYNLNGQRVENAVKGGLYITKQADGKTVKSIKK